MSWVAPVVEYRRAFVQRSIEVRATKAELCAHVDSIVAPDTELTSTAREIAVGKNTLWGRSLPVHFLF